METDRQGILWLVTGALVLIAAVTWVILSGGDDAGTPPAATTTTDAALTTGPAPSDDPSTAPSTTPAVPTGAPEAAPTDGPEQSGLDEEIPGAGAERTMDPNYRVPEYDPGEALPGEYGARPTTTASPPPAPTPLEGADGLEPVPSDESDPRWVAGEYVRHARSIHYQRTPYWWADEAEFITEEHRRFLADMSAATEDEGWTDAVIDSRMVSTPHGLEAVVLEESDSEALVLVRWTSRVQRADQPLQYADPQITHIKLRLVDDAWLVDGEVAGHH